MIGPPPAAGNLKVPRAAWGPLSHSFERFRTSDSASDHIQVPIEAGAQGDAAGKRFSSGAKFSKPAEPDSEAARALRPLASSNTRGLPVALAASGCQRFGSEPGTGTSWQRRC
jgi:hypothetical protein